MSDRPQNLSRSTQPQPAAQADTRTATASQAQVADLAQIADLAIIIVSWNVRDLLASCLESIAAGPLHRIGPDGKSWGDAAAHPLRAQVIVVDSASRDGSADMIRERFPWVHLLARDDNIGFVGGNNLALQHAQARYHLLLNPDTVVHGDALNRLLGFMDAHPTVGIAGPQALNADGSHQSTRRRFPRVATAFFESTWLQPYAPPALLDEFYVHDQPDDGVFEVDWVQGCALLARADVYAQIGGLDAQFVMFSEELDWCRRAKQVGWRVYYVGEARITHYGGQSTGQVPARKHIYFQQSKLIYTARYHGSLIAAALRVFLLLSYAGQIALEGGKLLLGHKRELRRARIQTYFQVLRALLTQD